MKSILRKAFSDLRRHRLQTAVVGVVVLLAAATATLALTLLIGAQNPYDQAFAQQRGAHVLQEFNGAHVSTAQLRATAQLPAVAASTAPWPTLSLTFEPAVIPADQRRMVAQFGPPKLSLEVVGRRHLGGPVDRLRLVSGHWLRLPQEIVVTRSFAQNEGVSLGDRIIAVAGRVRSSFIIAGEVIDVDEEDAANQNPQHAWTFPSRLPALVTPETPLGYEMGYRFQRAATDADLQVGLTQIRRSLPTGAFGFTRTYLDIRQVFNLTNSLILTFLLAFSVFALGATALIIANVVTGSVLAGFRDIGIMKAIGYTPAQVVLVLVAQMLAPALGACLIGIPMGILISRPLVSKSADAVGLPAPAALSPGVVLLVLFGILLVVAISAAIPASRAGFLSPVRAIVAGTAPEGRKGLWLARRLAALRLPQWMRLGIVQALARPVRAAFTAAAILVGVATLTFAFGLRSTLQHGLNDPAINGGNYQVEVSRIPGYPDARVLQTLRAQPQTAAIVARDWASVAVDGISRPVQTVFTRGDATALGLHAQQGRWYAAPGEAVAPSAFLKEAHLQVGDFFTGSINGHRERFHLVGTVFDTNEFGRILHMDWSTLAQVMPAERPSDYLVRLRPATDVQGYAIRVNETARNFLTVGTNESNAASTIATINDVVVVLALILAIIAIVAVFNTILLNTRERAQDTAILKAIGMGPRQAMLMVATSAAVLGAAGAIAGIPVGVALHSLILQAMGNQIGNDVSTVQYGAFSAPSLVLLALAGVAVAVLGSLLPARWSVQTRVSEVLHAE